MPTADFVTTRNKALAETIDAAFERREEIGPATTGAVRESVEHALDLLDRGEARVAEKAADGSWRVDRRSCHRHTISQPRVDGLGF